MSLAQALLKPGSGQGKGQSTLPPTTASSAPKNGDGQTTTTSSPNGKGKPLSFSEILTRNLSIMAALANADTSGSLEDPNGERYGMVGGTNVGGPNLQILQVAVGVFSLVGNPIKSGKEFLEIVERSLKQGKIVGILDPKVLTKEMAETLATSPEKKEVENLLKWLKEQPHDVPISQWPIESFGVSMAQSLNQAQVILPYSRAGIFTKGWERFYQAHHILEVNMFETLGKAELANDGPAIILSKAEHDFITGELAKARKKLFDDVTKRRGTDALPNKAEVWAMYQKVYKDQPHWLTAIEHYFGS